MGFRRECRFGEDGNRCLRPSCYNCEEVHETHLPDLLDRINIDRASRNEPPWSMGDLLSSIEDDPSILSLA
jgi:hypothetical protein